MARTYVQLDEPPVKLGFLRPLMAEMSESRSNRESRCKAHLVKGENGEEDKE